MTIRIIKKKKTFLYKSTHVWQCFHVESECQASWFSFFHFCRNAELPSQQIITHVYLYISIIVGVKGEKGDPGEKGERGTKGDSGVGGVLPTNGAKGEKVMWLRVALLSCFHPKGTKFLLLLPKEIESRHHSLSHHLLPALSFASSRMPSLLQKSLWLEFLSILLGWDEWRFAFSEWRGENVVIFFCMCSEVTLHQI